MIKIDRLRSVSFIVILVAILLLVGEWSTGVRYNNSIAIVILVLLSVAIEKIRLEFRDLREQIENQRK